MTLLDIERQLWAKGFKRLAGMDEAGRGPLAGPVVAAAIVFPRQLLEREERGLFHKLTDSKLLAEKERDRFFEMLTLHPDIEIGIGFGDAAEIDSINILCSTHKAMLRALLNLPSLPEHALIDGREVPNLPCASTAIVKGDTKSLSIAAASIIAKVTRDQWMLELDKQHPEYGFKRHKGYGTTAHIQALLKHGITEQHRRTFRPVHDIDAIRARSNNVRCFAGPPDNRTRT